MSDDLTSAILGFLVMRPMTGYELKKISEKTIVHFWQFNLSQVYPALQQLHRDKCIEKHEEFVGDKARFVYTVTDVGHKHLHAWLSKRHEPESKKMSFLLKLYFCHGDVSLCRRHLRNYLAENQAKLAMLRALFDECSAMSGSGKNDYPPHSHLETIDFGIHMTNAKITWLKKRLPCSHHRGKIKNKKS